MADNTQQIGVSLDQMLYFKAKQDIENAKKFKSKNDATDLKGAVRYDAAQALNEQEKAQARANLGITENVDSSGGTVEGAVRHDVEQVLDEDDKARARENIGAGTGTWADMPDKPFGECGETVIEMPSDISEKTTVSSQLISGIGDVVFTYVKVAEKLNSVSDVIGSLVSAVVNGATIDFVVDESQLRVGENGFVILYIEEANYIALPACLNVNNSGTVVVPTDAALGEDLIFNEAEEGLYFLHIEGVGQTNSLAVKEIKKIDNKYLPDGLVTTDENGFIPASKLPSYVDDTLEGYYNDDLFYEDESFEIVIAGEKGKIYVDLNTGNTYRWSGSVYVQLNPKEFRWATNEDIDALFT